MKLKLFFLFLVAVLAALILAAPAWGKSCRECHHRRTPTASATVTATASATITAAPTETAVPTLVPASTATRKPVAKRTKVPPGWEPGPVCVGPCAYMTMTARADGK